MKTAKISVYGNIAVYRNIAMSVYNCFILDTIMLRIHLFSIFNIKTPRALAALVSLGILIVKKLTNVLYYIPNKHGMTSSPCQLYILIMSIKIRYNINAYTWFIILQYVDICPIQTIIDKETGIFSILHRFIGFDNRI